MLSRSDLKAAAMLDDARYDVLAFAACPQRHRGQICETNPLERVNKGTKRRTDFAGVFPHPSALLRLAGSVLIEQHDEWGAGDRRYFSSASVLGLRAMNVPTEAVEQVNLIPELTATPAETTDRDVDEKPPHPTGRVLLN